MIKIGEHTVTKIVIVRGQGTDKVTFELRESPSPFPEMDKKEPGTYFPHFSVEVRRGYSEEWLKKMFDTSSIDPIVNLITVK